MFKLKLIFLAISWIMLSNLFLNQGFVSGQENYNLEVEVPSGIDSYLTGDKVWFTTKISNLANKARVDIVLKYSLLDSKGNKISERSETVAIETLVSFVGSLEIPQDLDSGDYLIRVELLSDSKESSFGEASIKINSRNDLQFFIQENYWWLFLILILILIFLFFKMIPLISKAHSKGILKNKIKELLGQKLKIINL